MKMWCEPKGLGEWSYAQCVSASVRLCACVRLCVCVCSCDVRLPTKVLPRDHPVLAKAVAFMREIAEVYMRGEVETEDLMNLRKKKLDQLEPMIKQKVLKRPASSMTSKENTDEAASEPPEIEKTDTEPIKHNTKKACNERNKQNKQNEQNEQKTEAKKDKKKKADKQQNEQNEQNEQKTVAKDKKKKADKQAELVASLLIAPAAIPPSLFEQAIDELEARGLEDKS